MTAELPTFRWSDLWGNPFTIEYDAQAASIPLFKVNPEAAAELGISELEMELDLLDNREVSISRWSDEAAHMGVPFDLSDYDCAVLCRQRWIETHHPEIRERQSTPSEDAPSPLAPDDDLPF